MVSGDICSKTVVMMMLIYCLLLLPLYVGVCVMSLFYYVVYLEFFLVVQSSRGGRELVALLCVLAVVWLLVFIHCLS